MPCAGLGIVIIVMFYPLPRFLAVSVLSLDSYIGFAVPCRFHTIRAVKFSVTVVAYYPAAKRARILEDFPLLAIFFPVDIMRFKNLLSCLAVKAAFPPALHTLLIFLFGFYFAVTKIGLYSSVYLALLHGCFLSGSNTILVILREYAVTLSFGIYARFTQYTITIAEIIAVYYAAGKFNTFLVKPSYNAIFSLQRLFTAFFIIDRAPCVIRYSLQIVPFYYLLCGSRATQ